MENTLTNTQLPVDYSFNLSDFALFLSVMRNPRAYQCTLSIILDEPDIQLKEVKVEQVILNKSGKRAIRLDAWALSEDERQFNMEMQNESQSDDLPKRSRFYQSLLDTPIPKSGRKTKYRQLPSTVIIFITQEDIFEKDLAKYTFTEQCEEVPGLKLEDGTTKIFLNMTSRNGSQELVSMLQYMKETRIDNPDILVYDPRIIELDQIVTEVKESEEWEAVKINLLEFGIERGKEIGLSQGRAEGLSQGRADGEILKLLSQTRKKLSKGRQISEIADALEESEETILSILHLMQQYPGATDEELLKKM